MRTWVMPVAMAAIVAGSAVSSQAAVLYQTEFDAAPFVPGAFESQDGWSGYGTANATIQDTTWLSFKQAVKYDAAIASAGQSAKLRPVYYTPGPADDQIVVYEVDALLTGNGTHATWGYQFYGQSGGGRGGFNVGPNGELTLVTAGFPTLPAGTITRGQWQRWAVAVDLGTQTFDVYLDGVLKAADKPFIAPISTFGAGGFSLFEGTTTTEVGYFDNYRVKTTTPEPASLLALGTLATLVMRRRK